MDAVSYAHSAKQAQRIEKFIGNPDSNSGVLTQPKVIEVGETVTIKSGRQAILADTVVDGDLVIEAGGDVFVPAGAGFSDLDERIDTLDNTTVKLTTAQTIADIKTFTSSPIVPTPTAQDNSTKVATTAYVDGKMVLGTAVSATGTSTDFTGIPSWAKKITIMFSEVSTNEPTHLLFQIGDSGGIENTGYIASSVVLASTGNAYLSGTAGLLIYNELISSNFNGELTVLKLTSDVYNLTLNASSSPDTRIHIGVSSKILSAVLDRIRVTTVSGTAIFDSGTINIMYEG